SQRIKLRSARFPSPEPITHSHPEDARTVLKQSEHSVAKTAVFSRAMHAAILNRAEFPGRGKSQPASPHRAFTILNDLKNHLASELWIFGEPAVLPTCKTFTSADPKSSVARGEQTANLVGGEMLT